MALQYLLYEVRKLNPVMDEPKEDFSFDCIDKMHETAETSKTSNANNYRKPFIPYNQELNTSAHAMHAGAA